MIRVGIIGGIGSGKSFISRLFVYPVFNADNVEKYIYKINIDCFNKLKKKTSKIYKNISYSKKRAHIVH